METLVMNERRARLLWPRAEDTFASLPRAGCKSMYGRLVTRLFVLLEASLLSWSCIARWVGRSKVSCASFLLYWSATKRRNGTHRTGSPCVHPIAGHQNLMYMVIDVASYEVLQEGPLPLVKDATLSWAGFTEDDVSDTFPAGVHDTWTNHLWTPSTRRPLPHRSQQYTTRQVFFTCWTVARVCVKLVGSLRWTLRLSLARKARTSDTGPSECRGIR